MTHTHPRKKKKDHNKLNTCKYLTGIQLRGVGELSALAFLGQKQKEV